MGMRRQAPGAEAFCIRGEWKYRSVFPNVQAVSTTTSKFSMTSIKISASCLPYSVYVRTYFPQSSQRCFFSSPPPSYSSSLQKVPVHEIEAEITPISSPLYNFLPDTENPNKTVALVCSSLKQRNPRGASLKEELSSRVLTSSEISKVLLRCQSDSHAALSFFDWARSINGTSNRLDTLNYCLMVHILAWSRNYSMAMQTLSQLVQLTTTAAKGDSVFTGLIHGTRMCNWSPVVFDMLIRVYVRAGMLKRGFKTFQNVIRMGVSPNVITINILLNALSQANHFSNCWKVYAQMERIGVSPNSCTLNIMIHSLCKSGDVDMVDDFLERMEEEEGLGPDIITYNMLVDSYCKRGRLKDAVYLYYIMYKRGVPPDLITYTSLISGFCKGGNVKDAHQLFLRMIHKGFKPDSISYNTLLHGYCKEGMLHEAKALFHDMIQNGVGPDDFSLQKLLEGYREHGKLISALNLILELPKFGLLISHEIHEYMIVALCADNRPYAAKNILDHISKQGFEPNMVIYRELIVSFCNCNYVDEALCLRDEMVGKKFKLCLDSYRGIINGLCVSSRNLEANSILQEMIDSGLEPDTEICRALITGQCDDKNFDEALFLLIRFAENFQVFDSVCYNKVVCLLGEKGNVGELMEFQEKMMKMGFTPSQLTCKYVVGGLHKAMKFHKH